MTAGLRVFVGLVSGAATGFAIARWAPGSAATIEGIARPLGSLWLNALQMTVVPFVLALVVVGVAQAAEAAAGGRIARRALGWIVGLAGAAAALTAIAAPRLFAACPRPSDLAAALQPAVAPPAAAEVAGVDRITGLVPVNVVAAAAEGAIAPLVVFALFFAFALTRLPAARREPVVALAHGIADAMVVIVDWVLLAGPLGVFALILPVAMRAGTSALGALGVYVAVLVAMYLVLTAAVYLIACLGGGESLLQFAATVLPVQAVAAGTQSSLASLPAMLKATTALGCPPRVSGLVLPLAVSLFRITSPAQYVTVTSFIGWAHGTPPDAGALTLAALLAVVVSLGSVGLPGQASFMGTNLPVVQAAGLPVEPLGLLLAVDVIPDVFATIGNVTADIALTSRIARAEERVDSGEGGRG